MRRCAFTVGALLIYRLGAHIPLPGLDLGGLLNAGGLPSGGATVRLGLFSLSLLPYLWATFILQFVALVSRRLRASWTDSEHSRQISERRTRVLAAAIAALQSHGIAHGLADVHGLVADPGPSFVISTVLTLTGGVLVLVWLAGQITARGIGNGIALILFAGMAPEWPNGILAMRQLVGQGAISPAMAVVVALIAVAVVAVIVAVERARRRLPLRFAERQAGGRTLPSQSAELALKINSAGIVPLFLASTVALIPFTVALSAGGDQPGWRHVLLSTFSYGRPLFFLFYVTAICFFTFLYTAFVCDPEQMADRLRTYGGAVPGVAPGEATAAHLDGIVSRIAAVGAAYLAILGLVPELLIAQVAVPFYLGGISLMICVCVTLDIEAQVRAHLARSGEPLRAGTTPTSPAAPSR
ncbi:MAG TPA: preprotein translocase subunit SecY [Xanthobacteraceae bacterium]|nr:preprotein translocase subunit SecY [Xanthobacteraceae bacterium]